MGLNSRLELIGGEANEKARLMAKARRTCCLHDCSGDVGGGLRQMTVLQHGAANKHKRKNKLTICNWKM